MRFGCNGSALIRIRVMTALYNDNEQIGLLGLEKVIKSKFAKEKVEANVEKRNKRKICLLTYSVVFRVNIC